MAETTGRDVALHIEGPRFPYHPALEKSFGISKSSWGVLCNMIYPNALSVEGILLASRYCQSRNLDVMKKPVHIVPIWDKKKGRMVESVWPGIGEYRITAQRCTDRPYAGCDATEFGPTIEKVFTGLKDKWENKRKVGTENIEVPVRFPEWAQITVYRLVAGMRCAFVGPRVYFEETYSPIGFGIKVPNDIWCKRPAGQLEKCAEAAALRKAFPEENLPPTADEMEGKEVDSAPTISLTPEFKQEAVSHAVDDHMQNFEEQPQEEEEPPMDPRDVEPPSDWEAVYDELAPGVTATKNPLELKGFMEENADQINKMGTMAPQKVVQKWLLLIDQQNKKFQKKK